MGRARLVYCIVPGAPWRDFERLSRLAPGLTRAVADWRLSRLSR